ncbi:M20/M25/M40 family metallo-hydrolase [Roseimaritima ulvae]|uniref:M20/M25/M40 family metallo-hydrolase n=1 Tax=Roseimaritima ulvae TaxID=980254 RepID=UPI00082B34CC|nr:M20/M25/M40 family metallo-hydrolase [Roseimaritima ulvae]
MFCIAFTLLIGFLSPPPVPAQQPLQTAPSAESGGAAGSAPAPVARMREDLQYLASDELTGRGPGTPGIDLAAQHIAAAFEEIGLQTELIDGQPFQPLELDLGAKAKAAETNHVTIMPSEGPTKQLELDKGMSPLSIGNSGKAEGPLVFAGYGITAPELQYDDYQDIDASGAVVMLIRKSPGGASKQSPFSERKHARHAFFATKVKNAIEHGAVAVLIVNDPASIEQQVKQLQRRVDGEKQRLRTVEETLQNAPEGLEQVRQTLQDTKRATEAQLQRLEDQLREGRAGLIGVDGAGGLDQPAAIPVVSISRQVADELLKPAAGASLKKLENAIAGELKPRSVALQDLQVAVQTDITQSTVQISNVIATLPGKGALAGESVVVGAHYDHVGMGGYGSLSPGTIAVHNGADDNASGTVTMLEVARRTMAQLQSVASHRRLIFIAFTGEERGLLGSKHYVKQPLFPLTQTVAMVNLDMVGRLQDNELTVYGTGTAPQFNALLDRLNEAAGFQMLRVPSGYGPSDHTSFYQAKVPVLFFFTGLHNDYHRPTDDFDKIDFGGLARITDMVTDVTRALATGPRPNYQSTEPGGSITRQLTVFFGIRMRNGDDSVTIAEVFEDSPAARAELRAGDKVVKIEGKAIQHSDGILAALRAKHPGDLLNVQIQRDGKTLNVRVLLAQRP